MDEQSEQEMDRMDYKTEDVFKKRDGNATVALCVELSKRGLLGAAAVCLYQAQYSSARAKTYRRSSRSNSYERKNIALMRMPRWLSRADIAYGWGYDATSINFEHVLYVELATGQCSFHSSERGDGPEFRGRWNPEVDSMTSVFRFCDQVLSLNMDSPAICCMPFGNYVGMPLVDIPVRYRDWLKENMPEEHEIIFESLGVSL